MTIHALSAGRIPRAVRSTTVSAAAPDPNTIAAQLASAFEDFQAKHNGELKGINAALDKMAWDVAGAQLRPGEAFSKPADPEYSATYASYVRKGIGEADLQQANATGERATINAALSVGTDANGGYLAPIEWDRKIVAAQRPTSPLRALATVISTTVRAYSTLWNSGGWGSGWVGETASRPQTTTATFSPLTFSAGEIYAMPAATQNLLEDAGINLENWLGDEVGAEFGRQEAIAFVSGDGANKPSGFLTYAVGGSNAGAHPGGALDTIETGAAGVIAPDELVDFLYGLAAPYRQNAT